MYNLKKSSAIQTIFHSPLLAIATFFLLLTSTAHAQAPYQIHFDKVRYGISPDFKFSTFPAHSGYFLISYYQQDGQLIGRERAVSLSGGTFTAHSNNISLASYKMLTGEHFRIEIKGEEDVTKTFWVHNSQKGRFIHHKDAEDFWKNAQLFLNTLIEDNLKTFMLMSEMSKTEKVTDSMIQQHQSDWDALRSELNLENSNFLILTSLDYHPEDIKDVEPTHNDDYTSTRFTATVTQFGKNVMDIRGEKTDGKWYFDI